MDNFSISMKGWWKMAISHLKHSYLNWRANPCRRKRLQFFDFFKFFWIWLCWFSFGLNRIFQVHDVTINFSFFFFFFFRSHDSSTPGNNACHRWPSRLKHHSSCENWFEKGSSFGSRVVHVISVQKKGMAQKCSIYVSKERGYGSKGYW